MSEFLDNIPGNPKFLYSAFQNFTNKDMIKMLEQQGVKVKNERGNRIFPVTDKSADVLNALIRILKELNIKIIMNSKVEKILVKEVSNCLRVEGVQTGIDEFMSADKIILATGGKSYPATGSTGDGYKFASSLGHHIIPAKGSLVPLKAKNKKVCKDLQGLSLRNVAIKILDTQKNKVIYEDFGEMLFTHFGVSGPTILSASAHMLRYRNVEQLLEQGKIKLSIDLKPALENEKLDLRLRRDFEEQKNKQFKNSLDKILPQKLIPTIINLSGINPEKRINEITKQERTKLVQLLKSFEITLSDFGEIEDAIITCRRN